MTRGVMSTRRVVVALVLSTAVVSSAMIAGAATMPRAGAVVDTVKQNAAVAPRFDPELPTKLDEFVPNRNLKSVHFDFDRAAIRGGDARTLESDARWLRANQPYAIVIEGYADERGSKPYNMALAKRRARAVRHELIAHGVQPDRITMVSYGEARPECRAKARSETCWSKNRRADILVRAVSSQNP